jgi:RNA polymerase sigma factor (sigma-70 family)
MSRLTDEQRALVELPESIKTAKCIAARYVVKFPKLAEDIRSAAMLGLVIAAIRYNPDIGISFNTFCRHRVRGAVLDFIREEFPLGFRRSDHRRPMIDKALHDDDVKSMDLPIGWEVETEDEITSMLRVLSKRDRGIVMRYFLEAGTDLEEIANDVGISKNRASHIVASSIRYIRELINPESNG